MKKKLYRPTFDSHPATSRVAVLFVVALLAFGDIAVFARQDSKPAPTAEQEAQDAPSIPGDQLDSLVAPIALYPDPLLSQVLVASTYPLEVVQLHQWLEQKGSFMNEKAVTEAVQKQDWDPSVQAMAVLPDVVKRMAENIKWMSDLGNAFLAQQGDVMDSVQRMRTAAQSKGNLKSNEQLKVETKEVESKTVVVIEQADPEVVYVPSYNPTEVWGVMAYPYPAVYYPPPGYYYGAAIGFGLGIAIGAAWGGGGWGWGCGWGHNDIDINMNNNFNRNANISGGNRNNIGGGNRANAGGGNKWQHNPQHRGGAPYSNRATATKYGGTARGDSMGSRQTSARQNSSQLGAGGRQAGSMDRGGGDRFNSGFGVGGGGGERIGSQDVSRGSGGSNRSSGSFGGNSSFGGGSYGGGSARSSSSRGSSSMGGMSRGGGGMSRGGGGMSRGGGGGRR